MIITRTPSKIPRTIGHPVFSPATQKQKQKEYYD